MNWLLSPPDPHVELSLNDAISRLRGAFATVSLDYEAGGAAVDEILAGTAARGEPFARAERLRRLRSQAALVWVAERDGGGRLEFLAFRENGSFVVHWRGLEDAPRAAAGNEDELCWEIGPSHAMKHEMQAAERSVARLARALGYTVTLI